MYKATNLTLIFVFLFFYGSTFSVKGQKLKGNGNVVEQATEVEVFNQLSLNGVFNTTLLQGDKPQVVIETDENLLETIQIIEEDGKLTIKGKKGVSIKSATKMHVYVTLQSLNNLEIKGVGNVGSENLLTFSEALNVDVKNVGNTSLQLNCTNLKALFASTGNISLDGEAQQATIKNKGVGNVNAFNFIVQDLEINNSGIGNVKIYAANTLSIQSSGVGNLKYKGDAEIKDFNVSGVGKVKKL